MIASWSISRILSRPFGNWAWDALTLTESEYSRVVFEEAAFCEVYEKEALKSTRAPHPDHPAETETAAENFELAWADWTELIFALNSMLTSSMSKFGITVSKRNGTVSLITADDPFSGLI